MTIDTLLFDLDGTLGDSLRGEQDLPPLELDLVRLYPGAAP